MVMAMCDGGMCLFVNVIEHDVGSFVCVLLAITNPIAIRGPIVLADGGVVTVRDLGEFALFDVKKMQFMAIITDQDLISAG